MKWSKFNRAAEGIKPIWPKNPIVIVAVLAILFVAFIAVKLSSTWVKGGDGTAAPIHSNADSIAVEKTDWPLNAHYDGLIQVGDEVVVFSSEGYLTAMHEGKIVCYLYTDAEQVFSLDGCIAVVSQGKVTQYDALGMVVKESDTAASNINDSALNQIALDCGEYRIEKNLFIEQVTFQNDAAKQVICSKSRFAEWLKPMEFLIAAVFVAFVLLLLVKNFGQIVSYCKDVFGDGRP